MAERINLPENSSETNRDSEIAELAKEQIKKQQESANEHTRHHEKHASIDEISKKAEHIAKSTDELNSKAEHESHAHQSHHRNSPHKINDLSRPQVLSRVQKQLSPTQRTFSKVVHNPVVEIASDITGGTVARPYGLLYGAIFSLLSTLGLYIFARHYGYEYPFIVGALFFVGGFIFGLFVEVFLRLIKKN